MNEKRYCINCGKPIKDEDTCPNCHYSTEISKAGATSIYPEIECKEANVRFESNKAILLIALVCIFIGIIIPALVYSANAETIEKSFAIFLIFAVTGLIFFAFFGINFIRYIILKRKGKEIEGTIYGYEDDKVAINGKFTQIVKILVINNEGHNILRYQLGDVTQPYPINSKVKLLTYNNMYTIMKK